MAQAVLMPKVGISVESCIITEWLKSPGDAVAMAEVLFTYETDKTSMECESTAQGVLLERFFDEGDEIPVLTPVCAVGRPGEDVSALRPCAQSPQLSPPAQAAPESEPDSSVPPAGRETTDITPAQGGVKISPRARRVAQRHGVNPAFAEASGPHGRVIERDVRAAVERGIGLGTGAVEANASSGSGIGGRVSISDTTQQSGAAYPVLEYADIKFTPTRRAISKSMATSLATIPQLTHSFSFDASAILSFRAQIKAQGESFALPSITLNDMILFAVSRVLPSYPELNSHMLDGETRRQFRDVNLGVAVDTPRGLTVPVIRRADRLSLSEIAVEAKRLARTAQEGGLLPDDMNGGTFTVTNLGALGVEHFTPVINPPQVAILGANSILQRPRKATDGSLELYPAMGISLTYDHRAIDGAPASRFAMDVCKKLENFALLLAE